MASGVLSLNGTFTYPIELLKTLTVDESSTFKKSVVIGESSSADSDKVCIAIGEDSVSKSDYGIAAGYKCYSYASHSVAIGNGNIAGTTDGSYGKYSFSLGMNSKSEKDYAFVFSGENGNTYYEAKDNGTFCINPRNDSDQSKPEYGFYVGDKTLPNIIEDYAKSSVQSNSNAFSDTNTFSKGFTVTGGTAAFSSGTLSANSSVAVKLDGTTQVVTQQSTDSSSKAASTAFVQSNIAKCVLISGSTMTGGLVLSGDPTIDNQAATKKYVDDNDEKISIDTSSQTFGQTIATLTKTTSDGSSTSTIKIPALKAGNHIQIGTSSNGGEITISSDAEIKINGGTLKVPVGTIIPYAGNGVPSGFLFCDGSILNVSEYQELFDAIGYTFGGNRTSTFALPNLSDNRFLEGSNVNGTVNSAGLPKPSITSTDSGHTHGIKYDKNVVTSVWENKGLGTGSAGVLSDYITTGYANITSTVADDSIYGNSSTVQPKSLTVKYFIKYTTLTEENYARKVNNIEADDEGNVALNSEDWIFTLSDGNSVTKTVCIK